MKKKLGLNELKVKSFLTNLEKEGTNTVKGGEYLSAFSDCGYGPCASQRHCSGAWCD